MNLSQLDGIGRWKLLCECVPSKFWRQWTATDSTLLALKPSQSLSAMLDDIDELFRDVIDALGNSLEPKHREIPYVEAAEFLAGLLLLDWKEPKFEARCFDIARCTLAYFGFRLKGTRLDAIEELRKLYKLDVSHGRERAELTQSIVNAHFIENHLPQSFQEDIRYLKNVVEFQQEFDLDSRQFPIGVLVKVLS